MAAFIAIILGKDFNASTLANGGPVWKWIGFAGIGIVLAHGAYLTGIIINTLSDLDIQYWVENRMAKHLPADWNFPGAENRPRGFWSRYNGGMQIGITLLLAVGAYLAALVRFSL